MTDDLTTCPKCGALRNPSADRCWQCKEYLHGTALEGRLLQLLPANLARSPGTGIAILFIFAYYVLMVVLSGPQYLLGFSGFTLQQLGALHGPSLLLGQSWRYLTYMFSHADLLHLGFNVAALNAVGPVLEELFDKKKMFLTFVAAGVSGGLCSLLYYVYLKGGGAVAFVSPGASGAVSGMIGAALIGARRMGFDGRELARDMTRWAIYMVIWGLAMSGVNNAAHLGGFLAGAGMARVFHLGLTSTPLRQKVLSVASIAVLILILASTGAMIRNVVGFPVALERDAESLGIFGFVYRRGAEWESSDQLRVLSACAGRDQDPAQRLYACELNVRVNDHHPLSYLVLAELVEQQGDTARAARLRNIAGRIDAGQNHAP